MNRFIPDRTGIAAIGRTEDVRRHLEAAANEAAQQAKAIAPTDTFDYRDSINVVSGVEGATALARINADDWKSVFIEFGTGPVAPTPAYAPLRRGAEAAGLDLREGEATDGA
jgi:hypothetical protein